MKKVIQIVLAVVIIGLAYVLYKQITNPLEFKKIKAARETVITGRLKDIRTAQRAFKQMNQRFTGSFDTLINFVLHDSMVFERAFGSADDSIAVAKGLVKHETFKIPVIDTIFGTRVLTPAQVKDFPNIPFGNGAQFIMAAGILTTESKVVVPVFECKAPYKDYLGDLDRQWLINLIDDRKIIDRYPGLKVGSLTEATNEAGNWE